jgi:hypothetical protein
VVALDAPHNERDSADHLVTDEHAGYPVTIKANLPRLLAAAERALAGNGFWRSPEKKPARTTVHFSGFLSGQLLIATGWRRHIGPGHHRDHVEYRPESAVASTSKVARAPCVGQPLAAETRQPAAWCVSRYRPEDRRGTDRGFNSRHI